MRKLALTILVLLMVVIFPTISWAGKLEELEEHIRFSPLDANGYFNLGLFYFKNRRYEDATIYYEKAIRIKIV